MGLTDILYLIVGPIFYYGTVLLISRFVFLENGIEGKKGNYFRIATMIIAVIANLVGGDVLSNNLMTLFVGINLFCGKKEKLRQKFLALLLIFPIFGLQQGIMNLPNTIMSIKGADDRRLAQSIIYLIVLALIVAVYYLKKDSVKSLLIESENRNLQSWERILLCFIGVILLFDPAVIFDDMHSMFSHSQIIFEDAESKFDYEVEFYILIILYAIGQFILAVTVISLVLAGNRQNFYHNKVSSMQFNIIVMMAEIVESRDKNTGGHIKRTARYVEIIAHQLKRNGKYKDILTESYISNVCVAAPLHDIGKIHVSDTILNKEGPLNDDEFAVMKTHAPAGRALLNQAKQHLGEFEYLNIAVDMAGYHHEWWDGSNRGYPDKISGEEIPLSARIMAVADVFDALTSKRCYKPAMPIEKAYSIIKSERGTHFDPDVVDAFFDASSDIEAALVEFNNEQSAATNVECEV